MKEDQFGVEITNNCSQSENEGYTQIEYLE